MQSVNSIIVKQDKIIYALDKKSLTADVIGSDLAYGDIFIPRSITHENREFIITSINECSFKFQKQIKSISFPTDSETRSFENESFAFSDIESITIPSRVCRLEGEWCNRTIFFRRVKIMPNNPIFMCLNNQMILGKTCEKRENYDNLIFVCRSIEKFIIPSFITQIASCAFSSSIVSQIVTTSSITRICKSAFSYCGNLKEIEFPSDSELQTIEKDAFHCSSIESLTIPSSVCNLEEGWSNCVKNLTKLTIIQREEQNIQFFEDKLLIGKSNPKIDEYDILIFAARDIKSVTIPSSIKKIERDAFAFSSIEKVVIPSGVSEICEAAFVTCQQLEMVEIPHDSQLEKIGKNAFTCTNIEKIFIPRSVTQIKLGTFYDCRCLENVEFPCDSELQVIKNEAFGNTLIKRITIPSTVCELKKNWCLNTPYLENVIIMPNNKRYANYNENIVIGKSDVDSDEFDTLVL